MRWLIAGPSGPDTFADNVAASLRAMGHEVRTMPPSRARGKIARAHAGYVELRQRASGSYLSPADRWLLRTTREWRPDIFLAPTQVVGVEVLGEMKKLGVRARVAWWGDAPANMKRMGLATEEWDLLLFKDRAAASKFQRVGLNAHLLHEAMNPVWHRPLAEVANDQVVVAGNWYGFRQFVALALLARGVKLGLYGPPPPRWADERIRAAHSRRYIVREGKSRIFGEGLACLNSMSPAEGDSLNCRAFEIAGAGGLQVIEDRPAIAECFEPGKEVLVFCSIDEILGHLERAKRNPQEARKVRQAGARRALAEHTYEHRLRRIMQLVGL